MSLPPQARMLRMLRMLAWTAGLAGPRLRARLAHAFAARELRRSTKRARIVQLNLRLSGIDAEGLAHSTLTHTGLTALESLHFWTRPRDANLALVEAVDGLPLLEAAQQRGGVLLVAPHYGNWELLVQWFARRGPFSLLYTPASSAPLDAFVKHARARHGVRVVPASSHGMKPLLKALQRGELVGITPDQRPEGAGEWAPFFGAPALTMSLMQRLAAHSGATPLLCAAERVGFGGRFRVRIAPLPAAVAGPDLIDGARQLNRAIEAFVCSDVAQYQWTYKRYKGQRSGEALVNPYWPECY